MRSFVAKSLTTRWFIVTSVVLIFGGVFLIPRILESRPSIGVLPYLRGASWITYPYRASVAEHLDIELSAKFRREVVLDAPLTAAFIRVAAFRGFAIQVNGHEIPFRSPARNWKTPERVDIGRHLRSGTNEISILVSNSHGPPALWLKSETEALNLRSDTAWTASLAGAEWQWVKRASEPIWEVSGEDLCLFATPLASLRTCWVWIALALVISAFTAIFVPRFWNLTPWRLTVLAGCVITVSWIALFANNLTVLPSAYGYDSNGHLAYIKYVQERHALPNATEGWEMFQPPLYYLLSAGLLSLFRQTVTTVPAILILRVFGLVVGLAHCAIVFASLRLLFPGAKREPIWGLLLAACLAPLIYIAHYVTNEGLAACLVSGTFCLVLRLLVSDRPTNVLVAGMVILLGLAMLTKSTAVLVAPIAAAAVVFKNRKFGWKHTLVQLAILAIASFMICGWYYVRTWVQFGTPIIGVWDSKTGFKWWQDAGFHTYSYYLRFGSVFVKPWMAGLRSFWDGIYLTLWGDGLLGGMEDVCQRPPWNYGLMGTSFVLALVPTLAVAVGFAAAISKVIRERSITWLATIMLAGLTLGAMIYLSLVVPFHCSVKAFYGMCALVPFCALGALGLEKLSTLHKWIRPAAVTLFVTWGAVSFGTFWIVRNSSAMVQSQARSLAKDGDIAAAIQTLDKQLRRAPGDVSSRGLLVSLLMLINNHERAGAEARRVRKENPADPQALYALASMAAQAGNRRAALALAENGLASTPHYGPLIRLKSVLLLDEARTDDAVKVFRSALRLSPFNPDFRAAYGSTLYVNGESEEAERQIDLALQLSTAPREARERVASFLSAHERPELAERYLRENLATDPGRSSTVSALAAIMEKRGDLTGATDVLQKAIIANPKVAELHCRLANFYQNQKLGGEAVSEYLEALRLDPTNVEACNNLAWIRSTSPDASFRNGEQAVELAKRACELTGFKEAQLIGTLAAAYAEAGKYPEAIASAKQAYDLATERGEKTIAQKNADMRLLFEEKKPIRSE